MTRQRRRIAIRWWARLWFAALLALACRGVFAQTPAPRPPPGREVKSYSLPPDKLRKAVEYARIRNRLYFVSAGWGVLVLAGLLAARAAPRYRDWAERVSPRRIVQAFIFAPLLLLTLDCFDLPLAAYRHHLSLYYEQSIQGWGGWFWDWTKGELISFLLAGAAAWVLYAVIRRSPRRWWFYFWLASIPMVLFLVFITPVLIEPLFFRFVPLSARHPALAAEIQKVVARGGLAIPPARMFEMDASRKLTSINAYVTGIGASKRVVVWDNTVRKLDTPQTLFVFGHEMGHYVLHHMWLGIGLTCLGLLVSLFLAFHWLRWALRRWGVQWQIRAADDWASAPVLLLAAAVLGFLGDPIANSISRTMEHEADIYGLEVIHGLVPDAPQAAARAFQVLGELALSDPSPGPFIEFWLYDHPPVAERVRFSAEYNPWGKGVPPRYVP